MSENPYVALADPPALQESKQLTAIVNHEVSLTTIIRALKDEKGILTATQISCRGVGSLGRTASVKRFKAPPVKALKMLTVIVPAERADEIFDFIFEKADMDRPAGGIVTMGPLLGATPFTLPEGVEEEV